MTAREDNAILMAAAKIRQRRARERKAKRSKSPKADRGRVRDVAYLAWVRRQPCSVGHCPGAYCEGAIEAAHVRFPRLGELPTGMQRKPDDCRAVPLCRAHHREGPQAQHGGSERAWWWSWGIDPHALADRLYAEFQGS